MDLVKFGLFGVCGESGPSFPSSQAYIATEHNVMENADHIQEEEEEAKSFRIRMERDPTDRMR